MARRVGWLLVPILVAASLWLGVVTLLGTTAPLAVTDGISMLPALRSGELVVLEGVSPSALRAGDVVAVRVPREDQVRYRYAPVIVHRVADLVLQGTQLMVQTQGDNHQAPEPFLVPAGDVQGRLLLAIPYAGYPLLFAHSRPGEIALGGLLLLALLYFGLTSVAEAVEETAEAPAASLSPAAIATLTLAIEEYGQHLLSHTKVVRELGGTTEALHQAATTQNEVLASLQEVLQAMRQDMAAGRGGERLPSRTARKRGYAAPVPPDGGRLPSRRSRKRRAAGGGAMIA
jgi:signal peptidase I